MIKFSKTIVIIFIISLVMFFFSISTWNVNAAVTPMTVYSNTTMSNGIKINVNGIVTSIQDVTDPQVLKLNVYAPANIPNSTFYNMMLSEPICWNPTSQMIILKGSLVNSIK